MTPNTHTRACRVVDTQHENGEKLDDPLDHADRYNTVYSMSRGDQLTVADDLAADSELAEDILPMKQQCAD